MTDTAHCVAAHHYRLTHIVTCRTQFAGSSAKIGLNQLDHFAHVLRFGNSGTGAIGGTLITGVGRLYLDQHGRLGFFSYYAP
jgi:hypothetical protein